MKHPFFGKSEENKDLNRRSALTQVAKGVSLTSLFAASASLLASRSANAQDATTFAEGEEGGGEVCVGPRPLLANQKFITSANLQEEGGMIELTEDENEAGIETCFNDDLNPPLDPPILSQSCDETGC